MDVKNSASIKPFAFSSFSFVFLSVSEDKAKSMNRHSSSRGNPRLPKVLLRLIGAYLDDSSRRKYILGVAPCYGPESLELSDPCLNSRNLWMLKGITSITSLGVRYSGWVGDFRVIGTLSNLQLLDLSYSGAWDISFLGGLSRLRALDLSSCRDVHDFTPLQNCTNLVSLGLSHTTIHDISPLSGLSCLRYLDLKVCRSIENFAPLQHLTSLEQLDLRRTKIRDLSALCHLERLRLLDLHGCSGVDTLEPLRNVKSLRVVFLLGWREGDLGIDEWLAEVRELQEHLPDCLISRDY